MTMRGGRGEEVGPFCSASSRQRQNLVLRWEERWVERRGGKVKMSLECQTLYSYVSNDRKWHCSVTSIDLFLLIAIPGRRVVLEKID